MASLLKSCVEHKVIINDVIKDNNKVLGDKINKTVKLDKLERSMEEAVYIFQNVVEAEHQNGGGQKKQPLAEKENPASRSNQEHGIDKAIKIET